MSSLVKTNAKTQERYLELNEYAVEGTNTELEWGIGKTSNYDGTLICFAGYVMKIVRGTI